MTSGVALAAPDDGAAETAKAVTAGSFLVEHPTLLSLGFEWRISGDANRTATVEVFYREKGAQEWRKGLPMQRLNGEKLGGGDQSGRPNGLSFTSPNMFAGSVLNLKPDTEYECRFVLADPDGVNGQAEQLVTVRTRKAPAPAPGGHVYNVYPFGWKGPKAEPAFTGLMAAYNLGANESDHSIAFPPRVQPGDTVLVHAGVYLDARFNYSGFDPKAAGYGTPFDGTYYLLGNGTPEKPIVIKAAGDGEVVFDGGGNYNLFNLEAANYNYFEGITVRNTTVAFLLGIKGIAGSSGFSLVHSLAYDVGRVVQDEWAGSKDFYIADNVFIGRHDPNKLLAWYFRPEVWSKFPNFPAPITSEYAIKVYGQGHVVANNYVANWHDGIDVSTYGIPSTDIDKIPQSIDIYRNDFYGMADNCVEADGGAQNTRVFENRCFNSVGGAFSVQPSYGGPVYIYRNISYAGTTGGPLKLFEMSAGIHVYQNTFVGQGNLIRTISNSHFRNNLFVGDNWPEPVFTMNTTTNYSDSDYNGFRPNPNAKFAFKWDSPDFATLADYTGKLVTREFKTLPEYQKATGQDRHSLLVDYNVFRKVTMPDPADPQHLYSPEDFDFRLAAKSAAIDKGVFLPNIDDGYTGKAPDLGAYETGQPIPHYGPSSWPVGMQTAPRSVAGPPQQ